MQETIVKRMSSIIATVAAVFLAGATAAFAAELPTYEVAGLPISPLQVAVVGAAHVREQSQVTSAAASRHQLSVLTPRNKVKAATTAPVTTGAAR
jgi:hypothetical protein